MNLSTIRHYLSSHCETSDKHESEMLRTHYYKSTNGKALKVLQSVIETIQGYKITSVSEEHGEISVEISAPKKGFLVISVIQVRPMETAIDFSVTYEGFFGIGFCQKVVSTLYEKLDKELQVIGNG
ncbi:cytosolic protein [Bacillus salitolerans]|uniref:Cytosolic protein n=1 Tax=Bacillus salitolerans TaxID=1437434 RepID=A0ABW4LQM0_9BACI